MSLSSSHLTVFFVVRHLDELQPEPEKGQKVKNTFGSQKLYLPILRFSTELGDFDDLDVAEDLPDLEEAAEDEGTP